MENTFSQVMPVDYENNQQNGINLEETIPIGSEFEVDVLLIQVGDLENEMSRIHELHKQEVEHVNFWKEQELDKLNKKHTWLKFNIELYLTRSEKKRLNLPHGQVGYRKQPFHVEVLNENELISGGFVRTKESVDRKSILTHFKATGEIPQGCEIERPEDKLYVKPSIIKIGE